MRIETNLPETEAQQGQASQTIPPANHPEASTWGMPPEYADTIRKAAAKSVFGEWHWQRIPRSEFFNMALDAIVEAAVEVRKTFGRDILSSTGVAATFRKDLAVRQVCECSSDDGCVFDAILFTAGSEAEVIVWLEDDSRRCCIAYRGSEDAVRRLGCEANLFKVGRFVVSDEQQAAEEYLGGVC